MGQLSCSVQRAQCAPPDDADGVDGVDDEPGGGETRCSRCRYRH
jgi:hypothetical protein